ncbi:MAG: ABC transporter ATP-binding protein/permease [Patescibacteria group bacterium]|nr:ABC transporter ATP-binding protein/permease [Patescibacteria group bacterium]
MDNANINKHLTGKTLKIFWQHSQPYKWLLFWTVAAILTGSIFEILKPLFYKQFFDILGTNSPQASSLLRIVFYILLLGTGNWAMWRFATFAGAYFQAKAMTDMNYACFENLHRHSYRFFTNNFAGSLVRKVNKFSKSFETITDQFFWSLITIGIRVVAISVILFLYSKILGIIVITWSAAFIAINYWLSLYKLKFDITRTEMDTQTTAVLADTISNNINLKLFAAYGQENSNFKKILLKWYKAVITSWNLHNLTEAVQSLLMVVLEFAVFYFAVKYWQKGMISLGVFAMLQAYLVQLFNRLWDFGRNVRKIYESMADAVEMTEILETPLEIQDRPGAKRLKVTAGKIEFKGLGFRYHEQRDVFENFNLAINPGERVALVGPSGGGKSTVTRLLLRFFDIQDGKILIDGQDIAKVTQDSLRHSIALVPQDPILFHRTLMENIRYARPDASDEEVIIAAKMAHCHEFISQLPEGYKTYVGERGIKLSGGERQRVAIARAILKNAPVLILDEATSSLDSESEYYIQDALKNLMKNKTTIVIAHRLSTIMQMDRILVLDGGKITEQGRHEELLKMKEGTYQRLWEIQAGGFAAAG